MKLILVGTNIVSKAENDNSSQYNLAIYYLATYIKKIQPDIEIDIVNIPIHLMMHDLPEEFIKKVLSLKGDFYGLSSYCWDKEIILTLAKRIKEKYPLSKTILGGPTATFEGLDIINSYKDIDFIVVGEGERTLLQLINKNVDYSSIPGIIYKDKGRVKMTEPLEPIEELDEIPSPYIEGLLKPDAMNLMLGFSRGCTNKCKHCAWKSLGGGIRYFSKSRISAEIRWGLNNGYKHCFIYDSSLNSTDTRLKEITETIKHIDIDRRMAFTYFIDYTKWNTKQEEYLKGVNTRCILLGLESISDRAAKALGRSVVDLRLFEQVVDSLSKIGPIMISIMLGIPSESSRDFKKTVDYVTRLVEKYGNDKIIGVRVFWTVITPGSRLYLEQKKYNIVIANKGIPYFLSSNMFPREDMIESFEYIDHHKYRDIFIWEDADPVYYYPEIVDFNLGGEQKHIYEKDSIKLNFQIGQNIYAGWRIVDISYDNQSVLYTIKNPVSNWTLKVKVINNFKNKSQYRTKRFSLVILNEVYPKYRDDVNKLLNIMLKDIATYE
jgi:radical SAM superfamily enzyme YgiQ (UPF0313 family)